MEKTDASSKERSGAPPMSTPDTKPSGKWNKPESNSDQRFLVLLDEIAHLYARKQADYGRTTDPFANVRASENFGVPAWQGCMIRANDKMHRIQSFCLHGDLFNESVEDSLIDLAVYTIMALILYRERKTSHFDNACS